MKGVLSSGLGVKVRIGKKELSVHRAAMREGLTLDVELAYKELPLCTDQNSGQVEILSWPFLLPADLEL